MDYNKKPGKEIKKIGILENTIEPTISIITPFYNGGATLMETANSIFNQTYPFFEWVIIDDGSKDQPSLEELEKVRKMDKRVKVLHKENGGPAQARDYGIEHTNKSTKYVYFLDCDDIIDNTMLEVMYWTLETHKDASLVYPSIINFGDSEYYWEPNFSLEEEIVNNVMCINTMVKKDDLLEVGCFGIKEKAMYEDWNLWLKLLAKGKKPIRINAPLFWYRMSKSGEFARASKNHDNAMKLINSTVKTIKEDVEAIQFPKMSSTSLTNNRIDDMVLPKYKKEKQETILFILPEMVMSKNNIFDYEFIKQLSIKGYNCIAVTTYPIRNNLRQNLQDYVSEFYDLSNFLDYNDYPLFADYLVDSRNISCVFIDNSEYGYAMIPYIKSKHNDVKIVDYVTNDNSLKYSIELDEVIDMTFTDKKIDKNDVTIFDDYKNTYKIQKNKNIDSIKEKYNIPKDKRLVSFIGRISYDEQPMLFLKFAKTLLNNRSDVTFLISGNGPMFDNIKNSIKRLNLEKDICLLNQLDESTELYEISDLLISCTLKEGISISPYLALKHDVPVIITSAGKQAEIIDENMGKSIKEKIPMNEQLDKCVKSANDILDNIDSYKKNIKDTIEKNMSFVLNSVDIFVNTLKNIKLKQAKEEFPLLIYSYYLGQLAPKFEDSYVEYYEENLYISPRKKKETNKELIKIKKKFRTIGIKYRIENELVYIFGYLKCWFKFISGLIDAIIGLVLIVLKFLPSLWNFIKLLVRIIKVKLYEIKRKLQK